MIILIVLIILIVILLYQTFRAKKLTKNTVLCFTGGLGAGKTFMGVKSTLRYYKLMRLRYYIGKLPFMCALGIGVKTKPVIYSNIPIKYGKKKYAEIFTREHLLMSAALPMGAIVFIDEIGQFASQYDYDNPYVMVLVQRFIRFYRHFIENGKLIVTDQSNSNIVVAIRRRINVIYNLNNFRRFCGVLPFFKVDVNELQSIEDTINTNNLELTDTEYFFGFLPYKWQKNKRHYDSRCYSIMYMLEPSNVAPDTWRADLKTDYLIDIECSEEERKYYKRYNELPKK